MNDIYDQRRIHGLIKRKYNFLFSREIGTAMPVFEALLFDLIVQKHYLLFWNGIL